MAQKHEVEVSGTPAHDPVTQKVSAALKKSIEEELAKEQHTAGAAARPARISIHGTWGQA